MEKIGLIIIVGINLMSTTPTLNSSSNCSISKKWRMINVHCTKSFSNKDIGKLPLGIMNMKLVLENTVTLHELMFDGITNIYEFTIHGKRLSSIGGNVFVHFTSLIRLSVIDTAIQQLQGYIFSGLITLMSLKIKNNNRLLAIDNSTFTGLMNLRVLHLSGNNLKTLTKSTFLNLHKLHELDLSKNYLTTIDERLFLNLQSLRTLKLNGNMINSLHKKTFSGLGKLYSLNLAKNTLNFCCDDLFYGLNKLSELNLENNSLSSLSNNCFSELESIRKINLSHNNLTQIQGKTFFRSTTLIHLDLSKNKLTHFQNSTFLKLSRTLQLNLSNNYFRMLNKSMILGSINLYYFDASNNPIKYIHKDTFQGLTSLRWILFRKCELNHVPETLLWGLSNLEKLDLSKNRLTFIQNDSFKDMKRLKYLYLTHNDGLVLSEKTFRPLHNLLELYIANINLTLIPSKIFHHSKKLRELHIQNNHLSNIDIVQICELKHLILLNASGNNLQILHLKQLSCLTDTHLSGEERYIDLRNNPFHCSFYFMNVLQTLSRSFLITANCGLNERKIKASVISKKTFTKNMTMHDIKNDTIQLTYDKRLMYTIGQQYYVVLDVKSTRSAFSHNLIDFVNYDVERDKRSNMLTIDIGSFIEICFECSNASCTCSRTNTPGSIQSSIEISQQKRQGNIFRFMIIVNGEIVKIIEKMNSNINKSVDLIISKGDKTNTTVETLKIYSGNLFSLMSNESVGIKRTTIVLSIAFFIVLFIIISYTVNALCNRYTVSV